MSFVLPVLSDHLPIMMGHCRTDEEIGAEHPAHPLGVEAELLRQKERQKGHEAAKAHDPKRGEGNQEHQRLVAEQRAEGGPRRLAEGEALSELILKAEPDERRPDDAGDDVELRRHAPTRQIDGEPADDGGRDDVPHLAPAVEQARAEPAPIGQFTRDERHGRRMVGRAPDAADEDKQQQKGVVGRVAVEQNGQGLGEQGEGQHGPPAPGVVRYEGKRELKNAVRHRVGRHDEARLDVVELEFRDDEREHGNEKLGVEGVDGVAARDREKVEYLRWGHKTSSDDGGCEK